jgi:hypothetical protein
VKTHCHVCGATLRRPEQYRRLARPDEQDAIYVCRDEARCEQRAAFDPVTGKPHGSTAGGAAASVSFPDLS